jgi:hypothetical protein
LLLLSLGRFNLSLIVSFLVLFDALIKVLIAFDVKGLLRKGLVAFFVGFLLPMLIAQHNKSN